MIFGSLYGGSYIYFKKSGIQAGLVKVNEMDFVTGAHDEERDREDLDASKSKTWQGKLLALI